MHPCRGVTVPGAAPTATLSASVGISGGWTPSPGAAEPRLAGVRRHRGWRGLYGVWWISTIAGGARNGMGELRSLLPWGVERDCPPPWTRPQRLQLPPSQGRVCSSADEPRFKSPRCGDEGQSIAPQHCISQDRRLRVGVLCPLNPPRCLSELSWAFEVASSPGALAGRGVIDAPGTILGETDGSSECTGLGDPKSAPGFATLVWRDLGR